MKWEQNVFWRRMSMFQGPEALMWALVTSEQKESRGWTVRLERVDRRGCPWIHTSVTPLLAIVIAWLPLLLEC